MKAWYDDVLIDLSGVAPDDRPEECSKEPPKISRLSCTRSMGARWAAAICDDRALCEQIDVPRLGSRTARRSLRAPFFALVEQLGIAPRQRNRCRSPKLLRLPWGSR